MGEASITRSCFASAAALLRLAALASLTFVSTIGRATRGGPAAPTPPRPCRRCMRTIPIRRRRSCSRPRGLAARRKLRALLDRGAAIDAKDREGKTALAKAAEADKLPLIKLIKLLLERGANVNVRARRWLDAASSMPPSRIGARVVALLVERGADPNFRPEGRSPLARRGPSMVRRTASPSS